MGETLSMAQDAGFDFDHADEEMRPLIDPALLAEMHKLGSVGLSNEIPFGAQLLEPTPYAAGGDDKDKPATKTSYDTLTTITHPSGRETTDYPVDQD